MDKQIRLHRAAMILTVIGLCLTGIAEVTALFLFQMVGGWFSFLALGLQTAVFFLLGMVLLWSGTGFFIAEYVTWKKSLRTPENA